jgi:transcriptional regulator with XRE-family HTH domain
MALGDVIKRWRLELGWKQDELVRRSGGRIAQSQVSDLERGKYPNPTMETVEGIAAAFNVSIDALVAAAKLAPGEIPSVAEVVAPGTPGLPGWVRDFHRWGVRMTPAQRRSILDLARTLAEEAARDGDAEVPAEPDGRPA